MELAAEVMRSWCSAFRRQDCSRRPPPDSWSRHVGAVSDTSNAHLRGSCASICLSGKVGSWSIGELRWTSCPTWLRNWQRYVLCPDCLLISCAEHKFIFKHCAPQKQTRDHKPGEHAILVHRAEFGKGFETSMEGATTALLHPNLHLPSSIQVKSTPATVYTNALFHLASSLITIIPHVSQVPDASVYINRTSCLLDLSRCPWSTSH